MVNHWQVSTPVKAAHHPLPWCRLEESGLLVHHFEVWRRGQRDPVFVYEQCMRCQTSRYDAKQGGSQDASLTNTGGGTE